MYEADQNDIPEPQSHPSRGRMNEEEMATLRASGDNDDQKRWVSPSPSPFSFECSRRSKTPCTCNKISPLDHVDWRMPLIKTVVKFMFILVVFGSLAYLCLLTVEDSRYTEQSGKVSTIKKFLCALTINCFRGAEHQIFAILERSIRKHGVRILLRARALPVEQLPCDKLLRDQQQVQY